MYTSPGEQEGRSSRVHASLHLTQPPQKHYNIYSSSFLWLESDGTHTPYPIPSRLTQKHVISVVSSLDTADEDCETHPNMQTGRDYVSILKHTKILTLSPSTLPFQRQIQPRMTYNGRQHDWISCFFSENPSQFEGVILLYFTQA